MVGNKKEITVIDYGMGNLFNIVRALEAIDCDVSVTGDANKIIKAERLLLPGVGAFEDGMKDLVINKLDNAIKEFVATDRPLLGICLDLAWLESGHVFGLLTESYF